MPTKSCGSAVIEVIIPFNKSGHRRCRACAAAWSTTTCCKACLAINPGDARWMTKSEIEAARKKVLSDD